MPEPRPRLEGFKLKDWPALWALTHGPAGIGRSRDALQSFS